MPEQSTATPSEAVLGFAAWLTTRNEPVTFGATHDAAPAAELVEQFRISQGFDAPRENFPEHLRPYPS